MLQRVWDWAKSIDGGSASVQPTGGCSSSDNGRPWLSSRIESNGGKAVGRGGTARGSAYANLHSPNSKSTRARTKRTKRTKASIRGASALKNARARANHGLV